MGERELWQKHNTMRGSRFASDFGIPIDEECIDRLKSGLPQRMTYSYFPEWCPLEVESYICCCNPVN